MRPRCVELVRVLKKTGTFLYHCDWHATRETELCEEFPDHVVTKWIGNTVAVARKHYLRVTDEHFQRAAGNAEPADKAAQNAAQLPAAMDCTPMQGEHDHTKTPMLLPLATHCSLMH